MPHSEAGRGLLTTNLELRSSNERYKLPHLSILRILCLDRFKGNFDRQVFNGTRIQAKDSMETKKPPTNSQL
ncbi:hypothetical protein TNCV_544361 [Trichonephila clavipes]|nr:hypothetical protein TNCV_544361 [Trichonephila clavipes]